MTQDGSSFNLLNTIDAITAINTTIINNQNIDIANVNNLQNELNTKENIFSVSYPLQMNNNVLSAILNTGPTGMQGIQGIQGLQGPNGTQGIQGPIGIQGLQGLQGLNGSNGSQGLQGLSLIHI